MPKFIVTVGAYEHKDSSSARDWYNISYQNEIDKGTFTDDPHMTVGESGKVVDYSVKPIAGYDAYYLKIDAENHIRVSYCVVSGDYAVIVQAFVLNHESSDGKPTVNDYTSYAPAVDDFVKSISIR